MGLLNNVIPFTLIVFGETRISSGLASILNATTITNSNPGTITTNLNHGYSTGQTCYVNGATGMTAINGATLTATVLNEKQFTCGINTSGYGAYTGNGVVTPNFRNTSVTINSYPDSYTIPFVLPPAQTVTMVVTWNTSSTNYVSPVSVAQLAQPALAQYINAIPVGAPINTLEMTAIFQDAVVSLIPTVLLTRLVFTIYINGIMTAPGSGTGIVSGDPESYFTIAQSSVTVEQG